VAVPQNPLLNVLIMKERAIFPIAIALLLAAGCATQPPPPPVSPVTPVGWTQDAQSGTVEAPASGWWSAFGAEALNAVEKEALEGNLSIAAALARVGQARAISAATRSRVFPDITFGASYGHQRLSGNRPLPIVTPLAVEPMDQDQHSTSFDLSYEFDLWGRVRSLRESADSATQARDADAVTAMNAVAAEVAIEYFSLRCAEERISSLDRSIAIQDQIAHTVSLRHERGMVEHSEKLAAESALAGLRAERAQAAQDRVASFCALAVLCGKAPAGFQIMEGRGLPENAPDFAIGTPASVLERRPDVVAASHALRSKAAEVGVAEAARLPGFSLSAQAGFLSDEAGNLLSGDSFIWGLVPQLRLPVFNAGRTKAELDRAKAAYEEAGYAWCLAVASALRDVEVSMGEIRASNERLRAADAALDLAGEQAGIAEKRREAGLVDDLALGSAQIAFQARERDKVAAWTRRLAASIRLAKALGLPASQ